MYKSNFIFLYDKYIIDSTDMHLSDLLNSRCQIGYVFFLDCLSAEGLDVTDRKNCREAVKRMLNVKKVFLLGITVSSPELMTHF